MSHIIKAKCSLTDPIRFTRAAQLLGVELLEQAVPRYWGTRSGGRESMVCDYVLKLPGKYDLGLKRAADGSFEYVCDNELLSGTFGAQDPGRQLLGENARGLVVAYAMAKVELDLERVGVQYIKVQLPDGRWEYQTPDPVDVVLGG